MTKENLINVIITFVCLSLIIIFASVQSFWAGFVYFSLSFIIILSLYWTVVLTIKFIDEYYKQFKNDFEFYCVQLLNSTTLTRKDIEENILFYKKQYKKSILKYKLFDLGKILFFIMIIIVVIVVMIKY